MKIMLVNLAKMVNDSGGLAKVNCAFANEMVGRGHEVVTLYQDDLVGDTFFPLNPQVKVINLQHAYGKDIVFPKYLKIKREIIRAFSTKWGRNVNNEFKKKYLLENLKKALVEFEPEIIIAFQPAASNLLLIDLNIKTPVITMSHGDPEDYFHTYPPCELPALEKSTVCQVLMPGFKQAIASRYPNTRVEVIGNVLPQYREQADLNAAKKVYKIVFIGRLVKNYKRPHLLIAAFAEIAAKFPNWNVEIYGSEDKKSYTESLKKLIAENNLLGRVFLKGTTDDVAAVLKAADLFVFPSAYEGFGLSVGEALSMGVPAIGYKSCSAINELIIDGKTGLLVADGVAPLAGGMAELMENKDKRVKLGSAAKLDMKKYSAAIIYEKWENLMNSIVNGRG